MAQIKGITEIILFVEDMGAQVSFYRDQLGLEISYPRNLEEYSQEAWVTFETGKCTLALHEGGEHRVGEATPLTAYRAKVVFSVDDIESARRELIAAGISLGEIRTAAPNVLVCDGEDPEGNQFSLESQG